MDQSLINKLTSLQNKIEREKEEQIKNQTILDTYMKKLSEYDCITVEEARELIAQTEKELRQEEKELQKDIDELESMMVKS